MLTWTERATLFKSLAALGTQPRWCLAPGRPSSIAFQKPSAPSPTARSGAISSPRCLMSMRSSRQLCALSAHPGLEADQFLLALGGRADQHEHTLGGRFHPGLQVDPIRPHVHVSPRRQVAFLPGIVIRLPFRRQPRDHGWRQVRRGLAQEGGERLLEVAGRHPAQVENRQQRVETLRPPRPLRQDRRGEADLLLRAYLAPVADLAATNLDRPDAGLDRAMRPMAVTHDAVATVR